jgi:hypothetical protein
VLAVLPLLVTLSDPISGNVGCVAGVAYLILIVHVLPTANGVVNEQVVAGVRLYRPPMLTARASAVIVNGAVPLLVTVTTLVTGARGVGMVKVRVRTPRTVVSDPLVAELKVNVPALLIPVPVKVTGEPVTVAPV